MAGTRRSPQADGATARAAVRARRPSLAAHVARRCAHRRRAVRRARFGRAARRRASMRARRSARTSSRSTFITACRARADAGPRSARVSPRRTASRCVMRYACRRAHGRTGIEAAARAARYDALRVGGASRRCGRRRCSRTIRTTRPRRCCCSCCAAPARTASPACRPRADAAGLRGCGRCSTSPRARLEAFVRTRGLALRRRRQQCRRRAIGAMRCASASFPPSREHCRRLSGNDRARRRAPGRSRAARRRPRGARRRGVDRHRHARSRSGFAALPPHRARNVLRHFLRHARSASPVGARDSRRCSTSSRAARADARVRLAHDGAVVGIHRGRIVVHAAAPPRFARAWHGEAVLDLAARTARVHAGARRRACARRASQRIASIVRAARGRRALAALRRNRPRRALKSWLQEAGIPTGSASACRSSSAATCWPPCRDSASTCFAAAPGAAGLRIEWKPAQPI